MANSSQDTLPHVAGYEGASGPASGAEECLALAIVWSGAEPHRVGEITFVPPDGVARVLGRGGGEGGSRLHFVRQRPETLEAMPPLQGASMSREQLRVTGAGDELRVERLGRCPMLVGGRTVNAAALREGETVHVLEQLVLVVVKRPLRMPKLRFFPAARVPAFGEPDLGGIVGESPAVWKLRDDLALVAQFDRHVLVLGESGTGKELAARAVHELSGRRARRMVARNAATFPPGLVDAELFGNARNYPNVGMAERPGLIGEADGSTLFLDEIGEMPQDSQAHLLRVLDAGGEYQRLGDGKPRRAKVRLVAATNRPAESLKHDILARLPLRITTPRLQDRREDVPLLAWHLLRAEAIENAGLLSGFFDPPGEAVGHPRIAPALVERLVARDYTHHVRELQGLILRAIMKSTGDRLEATDETNVVESGPGAPPLAPEDDPTPEAILASLERHGGVFERARKELGITSRFRFYRLLKKYNLRGRTGAEPA